MQSFTLCEDTCFVIRSLREGRDRVYFESHNCWTTNPAMATIFRSDEIAESVIIEHRKICQIKNEIIEAVPLYGEMLTAARGIR